MVSKRLLILLTAFMTLTGALLTSTPGQAQSTGDAKVIKYGDTATGEITADKTVVSFKFSGGKNDVVVLQMIPIYDKDGNALSTPTLIVTDPKGKTIADPSKGTIIFFSGTGKAYALQLPIKGDYGVTITKQKDSKNNGSFTLNLTKAELLKQDEAVQGSFIGKTQGLRYGAVYAVQSTDNFGIEYKHDSGELYPTVAVQTVDPQGVFYPVGLLAGEKLISGRIDVEGDKNLFIVTVGDYENNVRRDETDLNADFELTLVSLEASAKKP